MDKRQVEILECTIRDGNYTVNFKFTERDTSLVTQQLSQLGFKWIEVGHGLGLGAMEAGKGNMPACDADLIKAAKLQSGDAKIGMFFIPGIGKMEHLDMAKAQGLDFIRIGANASELETTYPFVRHARKIGLIPCVNMMKTYTVTPQEFADKGKGAYQEGAQIIYCVDSSGGMLPDDVAKYFDAIRKVCDCDLGFHGHNNLMLAIENCVTAYNHGAKFLDTTMCGIGRSAGNAPTEILVAVLDRLNISTGIDLFKLMDVIEEYMWPLVGQVRPHDMVGVVSGYSNFHSGFLGKVAKVAEKHNVDLRRLISRVSIDNQETVEDDHLDKVAKQIAGTRSPSASNQLFSFDVPEVASNRLSHSLLSVNALIDGLVVTSSKRAASKVVLQLVPSNEELDSLVMPEYVYSDERIVMGRVRYGSLAILNQVVEMAKSHISLFLVNLNQGWAKDALHTVSKIAGTHCVIPIRDEELRKLYLIETLDRVGQLYGKEACLIYGSDPLVERTISAGNFFHKVFIFNGASHSSVENKNVTILKSLDQCLDLDLRFNLIFIGANPMDADAHTFLNILKPDGRMFSMAPYIDSNLQSMLGDRFQFLPLYLAYSGLATRHFEREKFLL